MKLSEREQYNIKIPTEYGKSRPKVIYQKRGARKSLRFYGQILFVKLIKKKKVLSARFIYSFENSK